jgi:hypothetical protein
MTLYPAENEHERMLSQSEAEGLRKRLVSACGGTSGYWWPLSAERPPDAEAFQDYYFEHEFGYGPLRDILSVHGVATVVEFREDGKCYEVHTNQIEPRYTGHEGFWATGHFDWVIYASHEGSVTVAGKWLLPAVQTAWRSWRERVWTTPFYERPQ